MSNPIRQWWTAPDHFEWLSSYLVTRGIQRPLSVFVGSSVLFLGFIEFLMMHSPSGPSGTAGQVGGIVIAVAASAVMAGRLVEHHPILAASKFLNAFGVITVIPLMCQALLQVLGPDALNSDTDELTGLLNRRGFQIRVSEFLVSPERPTGEHLVVAMVDLDRFKQVNDTLGHAEGDAALIAVAGGLETGMGPRSLVSRIGGEEFLIAALTGDDDATSIAEGLREAVLAGRYGLTASVGAVAVPLVDVVASRAAEQLEMLIRLADEAMYDAKRAGGNRVAFRSVIGEL
ncbi:GGDEF domain-containing protein [Gordonia sp. CPCC 205515]|uniref:GGDEF domain-containing protein n=1 Tax=Gordonia sp. CPCC 205515 TaxID=3140791 RepID=UPI003AF33169